MGFDVTVLPSPPADSPRRTLEEAALQDGAIAAIRLTPSPDRVEVWIVDRITGKTVLRDVTISSRDPDRDATTAMRTVELLSASLMEVDAPHAPRGDTPAPPTIRAIAQLAPTAPGAEAPVVAVPSAPRISIDVGPAILGSPGGLIPFVGLTIGARAFFPPRVSAGVSVVVPFTAAHLDGPEGTSTSRVFVVAADATAHLARPGAVWDPRLGAGASLLVLHTEGTAASNVWRGFTHDTVSAGLFLKSSLGIALGDRTCLRADLVTGLALSQFALDYGGRTAATWGSPYFVGSLALEVDLH